MPDAAAVTRIAREKLGVLSRGATGEYAMLARLLDPDEPILAMVIGKVKDAGRGPSGCIVVATPRRLLVVGKGLITRRERVQEIPMSAVRGARVRLPASIVVELEAGALELSVAAPPPQLSALADAARRRPPRFPELDELARRKLGRVLGFGLEAPLVALAEALEDEEAVIDLAYWGDSGGVLAVCDRRLLAIPARGLGTGPAISLAYADIAGVGVEGATLSVGTHKGDHAFAQLGPPDAPHAMAIRIRARLR